VPRSQRALTLYPATDCTAATDIFGVSGRLAVKLLFNSLPVMSGCPSHRGSVRRVSRYHLTHVRYRTVAAGRVRWQLANWCMRGANWLSTTSLTAVVRGCWTVDFDSHGTHYSEWLHKPQSHKARLWLVLLTGKVSKNLDLYSTSS